MQRPRRRALVGPAKQRMPHCRRTMRCQRLLERRAGLVVASELDERFRPGVLPDRLTGQCRGEAVDLGKRVRGAFLPEQRTSKPAFARRSLGAMRIASR